MTAREPVLDIWASAIDEFPIGGSVTDKLTALVRFAVLAPSSHNSQPWLFRLVGDALELRADRRRRLPVVDPHNREQIISCGAALGAIETALHSFGHLADITLTPDPGQPDLLARIQLGRSYEATRLDHAMFRAIRERRTHRLPFLPRALDPDLMSDLETIAKASGVWFRILQSDHHRNVLAGRIMEGNRIQMEDAAFREELASWLHPHRTQSRDGMPGWAHGFSALESAVLPLVVRTFDTGDGKAAHDRELALGSPVLAVMATLHDTVTEWVQTGRALMQVLLRAAADGVMASYLNQPIEVDDLRKRVTSLLGNNVYPQLILRMGYPAQQDRHTPRRGLDEVMEGAG